MAKSKAAGQVYQLKITLRDIKPPVWRRVEVQDCTLAKLHDLIKPYQTAKLIDFDFNWAGSSTVRQQLIDRFQNEILAGRK